MKMTPSASLGLLALLPYAVVSDKQFGGLMPPLEQEHMKNLQISDPYTTAEKACAWEAQTVCDCGSTLPAFLPDFMEFSFDMIDPTPLIIIDNLFQSVFPEIFNDEDENQELNGFSSQSRHRRLEEVNNAEPKYLYDCPHIHSCLLQANEQQGQVVSYAQEFSDGFFFSSSSMNLLSNECSLALTGLKQSPSHDVERSLYDHENEELHFMPISISIMEPMLASSSSARSIEQSYNNEDMMVMMVDFLSFSTILLLLFMFLITLVRKSCCRSGGRGGQSSSESRKLKRSILQQIYSDPSLKKQIEAKIGESIGDVPPFPVSLQQGFAKKQLKTRTKRLLMLLVLFSMPFIFLDSESVKGDDSCCYFTMFMVSFVMIFFLARAYRRAQFMMYSIKNDDCTCCCCGGSTTNVENGTVSKSQECCECCQGTGVCPPACQLCCTEENGDCDDCCGCCAEDDVESASIDTSKHGDYRAPLLEGTGSSCEPQKDVVKSSTIMIIDGEPMTVV